MVMLAAANMDPEANTEPETLNLARKPNRHLSFGTGIHFCLGHQLARIEGRCALEALFKRWPNLELGVAHTQICWAGRPGLRAIAKLPVSNRSRDVCDMLRPPGGPAGSRSIQHDADALAHRYA